jgi:hypothetical protein
MSWKQPIPTDIPIFSQNRFRKSIFQHLLLRCTNIDCQVFIDGAYISLKRGQCILGRFEFAEEFGVKRSESLRVYRELKKIEKVNNLITIQKSRNCSIVTILNYDSWISFEQSNEQTVNNQRTISEQSVNTYKSVKSNKIEESENIIYTPEPSSEALASERVGDFNFDEALEMYQEITGSKRIDGKTKAQSAFKSRIRDGMTIDSFRLAVENMWQDTYHIETKHKHCSLAFILREDKFERFSSDEYVPKTPVKEIKSFDDMKRTKEQQAWERVEQLDKMIQNNKAPLGDVFLN